MPTTKNRDPEDGSYRVTFRLPYTGATQASVVGDFNDWSPTADPLVRQDDGTLSTELTLEGGRRYRFRYLLDDGRWENEWDADDYVDNEFGGTDSVLVLDDGLIDLTHAPGATDGAAPPAPRKSAKKAGKNRAPRTADER